MRESDILLQVGTNELEIIEFFVIDSSRAAEHEKLMFGVNVAKVLEVIEKPDMRPPSHPPHPSFMGTMPVRGKPLPIIDLATCLGLIKADYPFEVILITEFNKLRTGFLVSGVTGIFRIGWDEVLPPNRCLSELDTNCITGMVHFEDRFTLLLDLEKIISDINPEMTEQARTGESGSGSGYKALVAEDSTVMRSLLKGKLESGGFETRAEPNGADAWNYLLGLKKRCVVENVDITSLINVVVTDIEMPSMDGYTLTKRVKEDDVLGKLPVVLFSSLITPELRHKGESVGADDQVSKPEFDELTDRVLRLIENAS